VNYGNTFTGRHDLRHVKESRPDGR
jgi:hypothetical protein